MLQLGEEGFFIKEEGFRRQQGAFAITLVKGVA